MAGTCVSIAVICASAERRAFQEAQFRALNLPWPVRFYDAHTPADSGEYLADYPPEYMENERVLCCFRSHASAWAAYAAGDGGGDETRSDYCLFLEDDVALLADGFVESLTAVIEAWRKHESDVDYVSVAYLPWLDGWPSTSREADGLRLNVRVFGAQGYLLTQAMAREWAAKFHGPRAADILRTNVDDMVQRYGERIRATVRLTADGTPLHLYKQAASVKLLGVESQLPSLLNHDDHARTIWRPLALAHKVDGSKYYGSPTWCGESVTSPPPIAAEPARAPVPTPPLFGPLVLTAENVVEHPRARVFTSTLRRNGWAFDVVGVGKTWEGVQSKLRWYADGLRAQPADRIVVLSDSRDVFCLRSPRDFEHAFRTFRADMVVGMEMFSMGRLTYHEGFQCPDLSRYWWHWRVQKERRPLRQFVNSGLIAGKAATLLHWLEWSLARAHTDDQYALGEYMNAFPSRIAADVEGILLHNSGSGVCGGAVDLSQVSDAPTLMELAGRGAYFLHIPGAGGAKGQDLMYETVLRINPPELQHALAQLYPPAANMGWRAVLNIV